MWFPCNVDVWLIVAIEVYLLATYGLHSLHACTNSIVLATDAVLLVAQQVTPWAWRREHALLEMLLPLLALGMMVDASTRWYREHGLRANAQPSFCCGSWHTHYGIYAFVAWRSMYAVLTLLFAWAESFFSVAAKRQATDGEGEDELFDVELPSPKPLYRIVSARHRMIRSEQDV